MLDNRFNNQIYTFLVNIIMTKFFFKEKVFNNTEVKPHFYYIILFIYDYKHFRFGKYYL